MSNSTVNDTAPVNLLDYDPAALTELVQQRWGGKPFRARQLLRWIHQRGADSFDDMTDLARDFRSLLAQTSAIKAPPVSSAHDSADGTRKSLSAVDSTNAIATELIPEDDRGTLCISSQAGCTVACPFCSTGYQGFNRNLSTAEIIGQLWYAQRVLRSQSEAARIGDGQAPADAAN